MSDDSSDDGGRKSLLKMKSTLKANKQRLLVVPSRGISYRYRHLMNDFYNLLPHSKKDSKQAIGELNELSLLHQTNACLFFETRKHSDNYLSLSKTPLGPSVKFKTINLSTTDELKLVGNCLKGSRPILSFTSDFSTPHLALIKTLFEQTFAVPTSSRKVKPFIDHVMTFTVIQEKIWIRNYQIIPETINGQSEIKLSEIGPRLVLEIIRIFDGSFGGTTLFQNHDFQTPNKLRQLAKMEMVKKYQQKKGKGALEMPEVDHSLDIFQ